MTQSVQRSRAEQFHALHAGEPFLLPNAWDAMSALVLASEGFPAVATTSGGLSWSLGYRDGECAPWGEVVAAIRRIADGLPVPLSADIESGYANAPDELAHRITEVIEAGAVGVNIEDQQGGGLRDLRDACARISAARRAAEEAGVPIVLNARTDVFHLGWPPEEAAAEALRRAKSYLDAGASCIFLFGLADLDLMRRLAGEIGAPVNVVGRPGGPSFSEIAGAGIRRVSIAAGLSLHAYGAVREAAAQLKSTGDFGCLRTNFTRGQAQALARPQNREAP